MHPSALIAVVQRSEQAGFDAARCSDHLATWTERPGQSAFGLVRMVDGLLFTLPGTPVLFCGAEIGMGENFEQEGRLAVRTPVQWNSGRNGGFSDAAPSRLASPVIAGGFGPAHLNVENQHEDPDSLPNLIQTLVRHYRKAPEFGWGTFAVLERPHTAICAHSQTWSDTDRC
ncbi:MAG: hypothetical protein LH605_11485 [Microbacteriaceae bacterium]|nr:hypothetical protein [Microbacteriaceae bacterium]